MTDLSVTERRIRPIQEAASARNWKQALQLCDKWQKKGEKSDRFLALKASILINQIDKAQFDKGRAETLQLCQRSTPVTDIEALYQLQQNLRRLSVQNDEGLKLWDRAVSAVPNDKNLLMTWLNSSMVEANWLMAQKAAMALRKAFPKERKYEFWNMLLCLLAHNDESLTERDRTLFGTLAYRLISKAAEAISGDKTQILAPGKSIATVEEVALLTDIYIATGRSDEAVTALYGEKIGTRSEIAEQDLAMIFSLLLQSLSTSTNHDIIMTTLKNILSDNTLRAKGYPEDDRIWKLVGNFGSAKRSSLRADGITLVDSTLKSQRTCRAAHLAKLGLLGSTGPEQNQLELLTATKDYYQHFRAKPFCFDDLSPTLRLLKVDITRQFLEDINSSKSSDIEKLFVLKADYALLETPDSTDQEYVAFASKAIKVHKTLPVDKVERPEAAMLAALVLLRLAHRTKQIDSAIQASLILQTAYTQSPEYYPLAVRLIQLYRALGQMSLANNIFMSLNVKNMQWETVGHLLLTRISTLHPSQLRSVHASLNPLNALDAGLDMLDHMEESLNKAIRTGLEMGSYSNVLDSVKLKSDVQHSLNRRIYLIEERKIQHLVGVPIDAVLEAPPKKLIDKRDFSFINNYGADDGSLESLLECGPMPGASWVDTMSLVDYLTLYLKFELASQHAQATEALQAASKLLDNWSATGHEPLSELTNAEATCLKCYRQIVTIFRSLTTPAPKQDEIGTALESVYEWLAQNVNPSATRAGSIEVPTWQFIHGSYTYLEAINVVSLCTSLLSKRAKSSKDKLLAGLSENISKLQNAVTSAEAQIHTLARKLKDGINSSGVLGKLIDTASGVTVQEGKLAELAADYQKLSEECNGLYDEIAIEEHCGMMRESWDDALNGILAVKIKVTK